MMLCTSNNNLHDEHQDFLIGPLLMADVGAYGTVLLFWWCILWLMKSWWYGDRLYLVLNRTYINPPHFPLTPSILAEEGSKVSYVRSTEVKKTFFQSGFTRSFVSHTLHTWLHYRLQIQGKHNDIRKRHPSRHKFPGGPGGFTL